MTKETGSKGKTGLIIAIVAILIFGGITAYNYRKFKTQKTEEVIREEMVPVEVALVEKRPLAWILDQTGDIRPMVQVDVYPKIAGRIIERLLAERGDFIKKGKVVAILEDRTIKAQLREAKAGLRAAKAKLNEVEINLVLIRKDQARLKDLVKTHAISQQKMDQIDTQYNAALAGKELAIAQIEKAEATLARINILYKDHSVYAPVSGYVSARYIDQGAMSNRSQPIIRISDEATEKIVTTVTEQDYPHIKKGMETEIRVDAFPEKIFKGFVSIINPTLDPTTRTGEIEIHVPNKDLFLRSGMFAHIRIHLGVKEGLVIPRSASNRLPGTGSYYVYLIKDNKAVMKNIKTGVFQENYMEVREGLKQGEKVVIKGQNRLKDGLPVKIVGQSSIINPNGGGK